MIKIHFYKTNTNMTVNEKEWSYLRYTFCKETGFTATNGRGRLSFYLLPGEVTKILKKAAV